jgi:hypothetical protein
MLHNPAQRPKFLLVKETIGHIQELAFMTIGLRCRQSLLRPVQYARQ